MSTKTFIDTGYVVALTNHRDQYHAKASELAAAYEGQAFLTTDAVLLEIGNALARRFRREAAKVIDDLLSSEDVEVVRLTSELFEQALDLYRTHEDKQWGLIDCVSFVAMQQAGIHDALACDLHFEQAGFHALMRDAQ